MKTFFIIHLILGIWLALVNFTPIMAPTSLALNNVIIGVIIAVYNAYYLFARRNVEVKES
ncbi:MAG: hypothetical protein C4554_05685 [Dethiobacter sp.]|jgi:uncharacterized membrane-anchored protein|nr:MAG: hypothetical protein C4554_05685 [Dethiobacter sp.]